MAIVPETKISVPPLPADTVRRPLLRRELDAVRDVGLVCAPAGYGKTLLLAEWAEAGRPSIDTAWVHLDGDDDDPRLFWGALLAALARCPTVPAGATVRTGPDGRGWDLSAAGRPEFGASVVAALGELDRPVRLVLDDVHELSAPEVLHDVARLLRHRPGTVPVVLAGRWDPPIGLQRLRPQGRLVELRTDRLRLDRDEAEALLRRVGVQLHAEQLDRLYGQTDGWPVGLRFAATALQASSNVEGFLTRFSGVDRVVADYLVGEVLSGLPASSVELLRRTSVSDDVPVALAVELSGREDAGHVLAELESRSALVRRRGRTLETYRVQPLIRSYLRGDLQRRSPRIAGDLHSVAARWWLGQDHPAAALAHAAVAEDPALLVEVVRRVAVPLLVTGQHRALRRALRRAGDTVVAADPSLSVVAALAAHQSGDRPAGVAAARQARRRWPPEPPAQLATLGTIADRLGGLPRIVVREAPPGEADGLPLDEATELLSHVADCAARVREREGPADARPVRRTLDELLVRARRTGRDHLLLQCRATAAAAAAADRDVHAMREHAAHADALAGARGWTASPAALDALALLAHATLLAADPGRALHLVVDALPRAETAEPRLRFALQALQGAALADSGDRPGGLETLQHARVVLGDHDADQVEIALAATVEFDIALRLGHHAAASAVQGWLAGRCGTVGEAVVMRARADVLGGRVDQARATLRGLLDDGPPAVLPATVVEAHLLCSELAIRAEDRFAAALALRDAVGLAEPHDLLRPFVQARPAVRRLLAQQYGTLEVAHTLPGRALVLAPPDGERLDAALSVREQAVLELLPSLESLEEIAADLTVSVNTLKTHVRSIYGKLGVGNRRDAVVVGYEHGLIHRTVSPPRRGTARTGRHVPGRAGGATRRTG
ncbi:LuxR C-terminal-related transcriptional regulator [Pseudonocardia halophobica]|uniref:LuxR family transcriptional regulator n=1 Tax=Pseudonocardia halophobica TaxID=29401 RepID=A0A9W6L2P8_9PSEU|nr:LuxR C-terminal-related transcriptional regulator [Pseudonocardia halophobica]GLL12617.1 LuxR family transcriptional regulator [Pseudonocardia halophobica]